MAVFNSIPSEDVEYGLYTANDAAGQCTGPHHHIHVILILEAQTAENKERFGHSNSCLSIDDKGVIR